MPRALLIEDPLDAPDTAPEVTHLVQDLLASLKTALALEVECHDDRRHERGWLGERLPLGEERAAGGEDRQIQKWVGKEGLLVYFVGKHDHVNY